MTDLTHTQLAVAYFLAVSTVAVHFFGAVVVLRYLGSALHHARRLHELLQYEARIEAERRRLLELRQESGKKGNRPG